MRVFLKKQGNAFVPADAEEEEKLIEMPVGQVYRAELKRPRSYPNHKHMFRIFRYVIDNSDRFRNEDDLLLELKIRIGHYKEHITSDGKLVYTPKSVNFDSMGEDAFKQFKKKAIDVILDEFLPGHSLEERDQHFNNLWRMAA